MAEWMTMRDIAALARVQRPVVTVWRRRSRDSVRPFPPARERNHNQELFLREEVVAWLEATGRGNNPDVQGDAAAHAESSPAASDLAVLSALLVLRQLQGAPLATAGDADDLLDLADAYDPDDRYLFGELERCPDLSSFAGRADALVEAAWSAPAAHHLLIRHRLRSPVEPLARVALSDRARVLLRELFQPLADELGQPRVMDPTGCLGEAFAELAEGRWQALVMAGDLPAHRLARRQLVLADVPYREVGREGGDWSVTGSVAHLVVLPASDVPDSLPLDHLNLLDEIALQLDERQLALCLAPAATLTDPLAGEALLRRDQLLRDGVVRAIVRLPAGARPAQAREHSALWLVGAADPTPPAERWTMVADLGDRRLDGLHGLTDDLVAAWQGSEGARRRAWAQLHAVPTRELIAASGSLVRQRGQRSWPAAATGADRVVRLRAQDSAHLLAEYRLNPLDQPAELVTIGAALARGWLRLLPGRRLAVRGLPSGSVAVVEDPSVPWPRAPRVDRLSLLDHAEVELTEPGDVVFAVRPRPSAVVDVEGGSLVLTPARVLRVLPGAPLLPAVLASRINAATTTDWRAWPLAALPSPDREVLGEALHRLADERARLVAELAALDALAHDLTDAVESRQLRLTKENHGATSL